MLPIATASAAAEPVEVSNPSCIGPTDYALTLSADGTTLAGPDTGSSVAMPPAHADAHRYYVGIRSGFEDPHRHDRTDDNAIQQPANVWTTPGLVRA